VSRGSPNGFAASCAVLISFLRRSPAGGKTRYFVICLSSSLAQSISVYRGGLLIAREFASALLGQALNSMPF